MGELEGLKLNCIEENIPSLSLSGSGITVPHVSDWMWIIWCFIYFFSEYFFSFSFFFFIHFGLCLCFPSLFFKSKVHFLPLKFGFFGNSKFSFLTFMLTPSIYSSYNQFNNLIVFYKKFQPMIFVLDDSSLC